MLFLEHFYRCFTTSSKARSPFYSNLNTRLRYLLKAMAFYGIPMFSLISFSGYVSTVFYCHFLHGAFYLSIHPYIYIYPHMRTLFFLVVDWSLFNQSDLDGPWWKRCGFISYHPLSVAIKAPAASGDADGPRNVSFRRHRPSAIAASTGAGTESFGFEFVRSSNFDAFPSSFFFSEFDRVTGAVVGNARWRNGCGRRPNR